MAAHEQSPSSKFRPSKLEQLRWPESFDAPPRATSSTQHGDSEVSGAAGEHDAELLTSGGSAHGHTKPSNPTAGEASRSASQETPNGNAEPTGGQSDFLSGRKGEYLDTSELANTSGIAHWEDDGGGSSAAAATDTADSPVRGRTVWIIDAHSLIYQDFHAMPEMTGPAGQAVGAIHGFIRDVLDILEKRHPDYLLCAFDYSDITFRSDLFQAYKQHRAPMPDDLRSQLDGISRMLDAMGISQLAVPGFEADDIMATVARLVSEQGGYCVLVTNDKDCRQLLSERVWLYDIRTGKTLDREGLLQEWGIRPEQVVDYQSLVGDAVDGVPGVPLIGPKTARELLQRYGTLENLYAHLDELPRSKRRENLQQFRDQALLSRQLVRLRDDVPLALDWHAMRLGQFRTEALAELCREFGFRQLAQRLFRLAGVTAPKDATAIQYRVVDTPEALDALVANLREAKVFTLDLETTDVRPRWAEIVGVAVAWQDEQGWYIPVRAPAGEAVLDENLVKERLRPLIEDPARGKVGQNVKYDAVVLRAAGLRPAGWAFDTMVADYLLSPGERNHSLDDLARRYLDYETIKISSLIGTGSKQRRMDTVPVSQVAPYAAADAVLPLRLMPILQQRLRHAELEPLFRNLEMPLVDVLVEMEFRGIRVDIGQLHALSQQFAERLRALEDEIYRLAGEPFNIDSPRQVARVMFERLKLPVQKQTRLSGPSTDINVLEALAPLHPLPALMVEYRQLSKLKNTYLDALPSMVHPQTSRIHSSFKQDVAATGRIISQDPNLQNIPVRTPEGRAIRAAFLPEPGWRFITADYSQIELRILAHYCQDTTLLEAFRREEDIHSRVAAEIFGVPLDQVTPEQRRRAKTVNFGIIYGQTPFGLANSLGIEQEEAAAFIEAYFARYPGVQHFIEETLQRCRREGYVSTLLGRRRWIQGIRPAERRQDRSRTLPERIAVNTVIQGSAADIIKLAMVRLHRCLSEQRLAAAMLLQIHDELVFETPPEEEPALRRLLQEQMTQVIPLRVPLRIDIHSGQNWAECD